MIEPDRIARLEHDRRGYPIPWTVLRNAKGEPFFTVNDDRKAWKALRQKLCPICGERLGRWCWFAGGPHSAFNPHGWYIDLPGHHECVTFSLVTCPYLSMPKYLGRVDIVHPEKLPPEAKVLLDETVIPERPEVFVAAASDKVEMLVREEGLQPYLRPARPLLAYEYWRHGRRISWDEARPFLAAAFGQEWRPPELRG
jgi:hypothetical protein